MISALNTATRAATTGTVELEFAIEDLDSAGRAGGRGVGVCVQDRAPRAVGASVAVTRGH